jgi:hypothetical protein
MAIYWSRDSIPALHGLSPEEKKAAIMSVIHKVWRHWQVWLPFASLFFGYAMFFLLAPQFPNRLPIVVVSVLILAKLASLPRNSYLQHYLGSQQRKG